MREYRLFIRAAIRRKRSRLFAVFLLIFAAILCMGTGITVLQSGDETVSREMNRLGFGTFTIWIDGDGDSVSGEIQKISGVEEVRKQPLIYAGYEINGAYSDNEGQLLAFDPAGVPYEFISAEGTVCSANGIEPGTIYVSPALRSSYPFQIGDTITFELGRSHGKREFTIAGFFADGFMGSSMIDMKSFLICESDYEAIEDYLNDISEADRLGRIGAMLHVYGDGTDSISLLKRINEETDVSLYTEFTYQAESIQSYMLLLQNILCGFFLAFSVMLFLIAIVVVGKSAGDAIDEEKKNMAILKAMGLSSAKLQMVYLFIYEGIIFLGSMAGALLIRAMAGQIARGLVASTGLLIDIKLPIFTISALIVTYIVLFLLFLCRKTYPIVRISPMEAFRERDTAYTKSRTGFSGNHLICSMTIREVSSKKKAYIGIFVIGIILVYFLSVIGKMGNWLGPHGEGLMNAFSAAEHDIGVQPFNQSVPMAEIERIINWYSPVKESYELAMEDVAIEGLAVTANVLNDPDYFHILKGRVCEGKEILITETVSGELGVSIGDTVTVTGSGRSETYRISGIYQCANGMGRNIGMDLAGYSQIGNTTGFIWCYHYILEDGSVRDYVMDYLQNHYEGIDVHTNSWTGLDGIVRTMQGLMVMIYMIAAVLILLTVMLTADNLFRQESSNMAIYKSMGLSSGMLRRSFTLRFSMVVLTGGLIGCLLSELTADRVIRRIFANFGIADFSSNISILGTLVPIAAAAALFTLFAWISSSKINRISIVSLLNENEE